MLSQMTRLFATQIDYLIDINRKTHTLTELTDLLLKELADIFAQEKPDWVLIQGDTTTAFVASLVAFYHKIRVGHVEAGLRTHSLYSPFPEEANRNLIAKLAHLHFAPTEQARTNLIKENISPENVYVTGNTVIDALLWISKKITWKESWLNLFEGAAEIVQNKLKYILITGHRRESFGFELRNICQAIIRLADKYPHFHFIYPVHLNPNVRKTVYPLLSNISNIHLISPLEYEPFVYLMKHCQIILTDSGGIQEEAPSLEKPVLVMRKNTERIEGIKAGTAKLVGTDIKSILDSVSELIECPSLYKKMAKRTNPYGAGESAKEIVKILSDSN
jgi:UDP-N-acetylglucosamine 2-epimerase (non-hydrolysing)